MLEETAGTYRPATPTSYKGIRYKSKCEAIFARMMDVQDYFQWAYLEPQWQLYPNFEDGYIPDFWLRFDNKQVFIEYKTTQPKYDYMVNLKARINKADWLSSHNINAFLVVNGNPYDNPPNDKWEIYNIWSDPHFDQALFGAELSVVKNLAPKERNYRFDIIDDGIPDPRLSQLNMDVTVF